MSIPPMKMPDAREFASLARPDQLEVLRRATSRQKARLLLEVAEGDDLMELLPPQDLFLLARELGPDQIPEVLNMASPEQWTAFLDFDSWDGDRFDATTARSWLAVLLEGEEPRIAQTLLGMNFELLVLVFSQEVQVLSGPEDIEEDAERGEVLRRDGGYVLDYRDEEGAKLFGSLLDILFRYAPEFFVYLLEAVRSEGGSLLEESVYQQRATRLVDQGLPEPFAAQSVYAWLDPETYRAVGGRKVSLGGSERPAPAAALQLARPEGLLAEVLAGDLDAATTWELACLVNKVLMADLVDLGDLSAVREVASRSYGILNLALEYLAGSDAEAARQALATGYAEELFRLGYSLTLRLQQRARAVHSSSIGPYLDGQQRPLVDALRQLRPLFPESLVRPERGGLRPFAHLREVRLAEEWLDRLEIRRRLFEEHFPFAVPAPAEWELEGCSPAEGSALTLEIIFLTALANRLLDRPFSPQPLAVAELTGLHALLASQGKVDAGIRVQTVAWLESLAEGAGEFGARCLDLLEEEFCALAPGAIDPRYVGGLIVRIP